MQQVDIRSTGWCLLFSIKMSQKGTSFSRVKTRLERILRKRIASLLKRTFFFTSGVSINRSLDNYYVKHTSRVNTATLITFICKSNFYIISNTQKLFSYKKKKKKEKVPTYPPHKFHSHNLTFIFCLVEIKIFESIKKHLLHNIHVIISDVRTFSIKEL